VADPLVAASVAATKAKDWTQQRDDAIRAARTSHSLRAIAEAVGLSHAAVDKIARR